MSVERNVIRTQRDIVFNKSGDAFVVHAGQNRAVAPKQSVVDEKRLRAESSRFERGRFARVDGKCDFIDGFVLRIAVLNLDAVARYIVRKIFRV